MISFDTAICVITDWLPAEAVKWLNDQNESPLDLPYTPGDPVDDLEVRIEFSPGFYVPAKLSGHPDSRAPSEGESPEVLSVKVLKDDDEEGWDILPDLPTDYVRNKLLDLCWAEQNNLSNEF